MILSTDEIKTQLDLPNNLKQIVQDAANSGYTVSNGFGEIDVFKVDKNGKPLNGVFPVTQGLCITRNGLKYEVRNIMTRKPVRTQKEMRAILGL